MQHLHALNGLHTWLGWQERPVHHSHWWDWLSCCQKNIYVDIYIYICFLLVHAWKMPWCFLPKIHSDMVPQWPQTTERWMYGAGIAWGIQSWGWPGPDTAGPLSWGPPAGGLNRSHGCLLHDQPSNTDCGRWWSTVLGCVTLKEQCGWVIFSNQKQSQHLTQTHSPFTLYSSRNHNHLPTLPHPPSAPLPLPL